MEHIQLFLSGYVRVEVRSRSPKLWGWALYRENNDVVFEQSSDLFRHADDAWRAGQIALAQQMPSLQKVRKKATAVPAEAA